jgi:Flp pilus assembly protein TadD
VWASLAQTYWRLADKPGALRAARSAEKLGAGNPTVAHLLTIFYSETGDLKRAASFERAYALSNPDALGAAASLSLAAGDMPEALLFARQAVDRNATPANHNLLGRIQLVSGQPDAGVANLSAAWTADPQSEQFCFDYAQALLHRGDFAASADALSECLRSHPKSSQLQLALGVARYGQRRFDDAIDSFLKTIHLDPSVEQPYVFLGRMLDQAGPRLAEIASDYQAWNRKEPSNYLSSFLLAKALAASGGDAGAAGDLLRRSIRLKADFWESHLELGLLLSKQRKFSEAAAELQRSASLNPKEPLPHYHLARVYDRLGEPDQARAERALHERLSAVNDK